MPDRPIVLVGMMGAGKTSVGQRVAARLRRPFVDSDAEIERNAGRTIAQIWDERGETGFRALERSAIERLLAGGEAVIAAGGGAFVEPATRESIRAQATTIWLKVDPETLSRRLAGCDRPLLRGPDMRRAVAELLAARSADYACADLVVDGGGSPDEVADRIVMALAAETR